MWHRCCQRRRRRRCRSGRRCSRAPPTQPGTRTPLWLSCTFGALCRLQGARIGGQSRRLLWHGQGQIRGRGSAGLAWTPAFGTGSGEDMPSLLQGSSSHSRQCSPQRARLPAVSLCLHYGLLHDVGCCTSIPPFTLRLAGLVARRRRGRRRGGCRGAQQRLPSKL